MSTRLLGVAEPLERAAELQQLSALLAAAGSGRGQACVIEGPSGVGKSRLLDECAAYAEALGMSVLRARCSELTHVTTRSAMPVTCSKPYSFAPTLRRGPS
ncbi:MAG: hypothetical protein QOJ20_4095 [Mycobacterium sp.]|jgi:putative ribosome biogenesis GTPase RsgA|nr:hypothetical protein [Mycobacterium sp.]